MKTRYTYGDKTFFLKSYNSKQEKELLLIAMKLDNATSKNDLFDAVDDALEVLEFSGDIKSLTLKEKIALLWKYREVSVDDHIQVSFTCPHCHSRGDNAVFINNIWVPPENTSQYVRDNYDETGTIMLDDDANLDDYIRIKKDLNKYIGHFDFKRYCICPRCQKKVTIPINGIKFVLDNMSDKSLSGIYTQYNNLIYYSHYTKLDIDSMYPFERDIMTGILQDMMKKINEAKNNK